MFDDDLILIYFFVGLLLTIVGLTGTVLTWFLAGTGLLFMCFWAILTVGTCLMAVSLVYGQDNFNG